MISILYRIRVTYGDKHADQIRKAIKDSGYLWTYDYGSNAEIYTIAMVVDYSDEKLKRIIELTKDISE